MDKIIRIIALGWAKRYIVILLLGIFLLCLSSVSAVTLFQTNLSDKLILQYKMNDLGTDCYQEFTNVSTICGGLNTGTYDMITDGASTAILYSNYSKPIGATNATWEVRSGRVTIGRTNLTIPNDCFIQPKIYTRVKIVSSLGGEISFSCKNSTTWHNLTVSTVNLGGLVDPTIGNQWIDGNWDTHAIYAGGGWYTASTVTAADFYEEAMHFNSNYVLDSTGINNATNINVNSVVGKINNALSFNGTTQIYSSSFAQPNKNFSVSTWIKQNSYTSGQRFLSLDTSWEIDLENNKYYLRLYNTTDNVFYVLSDTDDPQNNVNQWVHIAFVVNDTNVLGYINGVLKKINTQTLTGLPITLSTLRVGTYWGGGDGYFKGSVDDVRIYNNTLTSLQIAGIYNNGFGTEDLTHDYLIENSQSFTNTTFSNNLNNYYLNLTYDSLFYTLAANLVYNNTAYPSSVYYSNGNDLVLVSSFNVPTVSNNVNKTFYWNISLTNNGVTNYYNSTKLNQTITPLTIDNCTSNTVLIYNFTMRDEVTRNILNASFNNTKFQIDLRISPLGNLNPFLTYSSTLNKQNPILICLSNNITSNYRKDLIISYSADGYVNKFYYVDNGTLSNSTENKDLYLLFSSLSTSFLFNYKNKDGLNDPNVVISTLRKYIGDGIFREVETSKQDSNGQTLVHLVEEDVIYQFNVTKDGVFQYLSDQYTAKCLDTPCTITINANPNQIIFPPQNEWDNLPQGYYFVTTNKSSRTATLTFNLNSTGLMNFSIYDYNGTGEKLITTGSLNAISGQISLFVPYSYSNKTYFAVIYYNNQKIDSEWIDLSETAKDIFGTTGLFFSFLALVSIVMVFVTQGEYMLIPFGFGVVVCVILVWLDLGYVGIITLFSMIGILLYKLSKRRRIQ